MQIEKWIIFSAYYSFLKCRKKIKVKYEILFMKNGKSKFYTLITSQSEYGKFLLKYANNKE